MNRIAYDQFHIGFIGTVEHLSSNQRKALSLTLDKFVNDNKKIDKFLHHTNQHGSVCDAHVIASQFDIKTISHPRLDAFGDHLFVVDQTLPPSLTPNFDIIDSCHLVIIAPSKNEASSSYVVQSIKYAHEKYKVWKILKPR